MSIGRDSYRFDTKNHWRRKQWNTVRLYMQNQGIPLPDATGVFLPGLESLDVAIAESKGFKALSLIGVEQNPSVASRLRALRRFPVICGRLEDVIASWPESRDLHFVLADLCSNFSGTSRRLAQALSDMMTRRTSPLVLVLNMLRGREHLQWARDVAVLRDCMNYCQSFEQSGYGPDGVPVDDAWLMCDEKSRAGIWMMFYLEMCISTRRVATGESEEDATDRLGMDLDGAKIFYVHAFDSYKSGTQVMDSVSVILMPKYYKTPVKYRTTGFRSMRRNITAAFAVQTMRENGTLPIGQR